MFELKLSKKRISFGFIFFGLFFIFFGINSSSAQNSILGNFSPSEISSKFQNKINLKINSSNYELSPAEISLWLKSQDSLRFNPNYLSEIENINFCSFEKFNCKIEHSLLDIYHIQKYSRLSIDRESLKKFLSDLSRKFNKDPVNAKLQFEEGRVSAFAISEDGISLDIDKSLEIIMNYFKSNNIQNELTLAYQETKPAISIESVNNLGINTLIGEGRSNFKGSTQNRIFNINVAIKRFQGILIAPNEEFSFTKILGEVDGEHGYREELVIKKDKTEPEFGGGICQVSTTVFRAAIYSGLKITARKNHAYPVQYYNPQGMDATVYVPRPDLRFINNTPGHILIQSEINGTELIFRFYGTNDGRKTNVIGPKIIERNSDGSMKTTFTQEVVDKNGKIIINDIFNSNYDSPDKYPHPGEILTEKPDDWSKKEWKKYKEEHNI